MSNREVVGSPQPQGVDEQIVYSIDFTAWGVSSVSTPVVKVDDVTMAYVDVTSTVLPTNTPTATGAVVTLSPLQALTEGHQYRIVCRVTSGAQVFEAYLRVNAER